MPKITISFDDLEEIISAMWGEAGSLEKKAEKLKQVERYATARSFADRAKILDEVADKLNNMWLDWTKNEISEAEIKIVSEEHIT